MQISASLNNSRVSPRKVRLVAGLIKGMDIISAEHQLAYLVKRSSAPMLKLLNSALANATNNLGLIRDNLFIKDIIVDEGAKLKRYRPKGFGSASPIQKKTSHIKLILEEKVPGLKSEKLGGHDQKAAAAEPEIGAKAEQKESREVKEKGMAKTRPRTEREIGKKSGVLGRMKNIRKFFRRKAV